MTRSSVLHGWASRSRPSRCRAKHYVNAASPTKAKRSECDRSPLVLFTQDLAGLPPALARAFRDKPVCDHCQTAVRMKRQAARRAARRKVTKLTHRRRPR